MSKALLKISSGVGSLLLLALLSVGGMWHTATTIFTHAQVSASVIATTHVDIFTGANTAGHHSFPIRSNTEERTIEELLEDFTEHHNEAANISDAALLSAARSDLSAEGGHYFSPGLAEALPPLYILFHSWKSFLA